MSGAPGAGAPGAGAPGAGAPGPIAAAPAGAAVPPAAAAATPPNRAAARVELIGAARWYGNVVAVNEVSFTLDAGVTGLLGPNGAGKSTLLHMIAGLLAPSDGHVLLDGRPTFGSPAIYRRLGLVPEREAVFAYLTARELAVVAARLHGLPDAAGAAERAIQLVDLADAADRPIATYSKGMRQRAKVASALVHDPDVLVLDEPFNGMDPRQRLHMMDLLGTLARQGRVILFSSHILEEVERVAERVLVMVAGRLAAAGDFREIRRLMTDRPHAFMLRTSNDRLLARHLVERPTVAGVLFENGRLEVRAAELATFTRELPSIARSAGVSIIELIPADELLESVFSYLVRP